MKVLVVIDMQKDFTTGVLGNAETAAIAKKVAEKIKAYKAENPGVPVIYTMDTHDNDYLNTQEGKKLPVPHCIKNTPGWELDTAVAKVIDKNNDICVEKTTFGAADLAGYVETADNIIWDISSLPQTMDTIEIVGVCTDICVISNAMILKAAFPEIPIIIDSNCCAGVTPESHETALKAMAACQIEIL